MLSKLTAVRRFQLSIGTWIVSVGVTATLPFYVLLYSSYLHEVDQIREAIALRDRGPVAAAPSGEALRAREKQSLERAALGGTMAFAFSLTLLMLLASRLRAQLGAVFTAEKDHRPPPSGISEFVQIRGALASARAEAGEGALALMQAQHDELTGLPGRSLFFRQAEALIESARRMPDGGVALLYIDLDDFKKINDQRGHVAGDVILKQVGAMLRECVRAPDAVGRVGGDEFVVCFSAPRELIRQLAQAATDRITQAICGIGPEVACSVGWAVSWPPCTLTDLISEADAAMYLAKEERKSRNSVPDAERQAVSA